MAGYIVEVIAGIPFEDYVEQNIFKPLGMEHSSFREPLSAALAPDMSVGYTYKNGLLKAENFELMNGMNPAGSSSACATDMAKFMIAHLQNGQFGDQRILKEENGQIHAHPSFRPRSAHRGQSPRFLGSRFQQPSSDRTRSKCDLLKF